MVAIIISLAFLPQFISYAAKLFQQSETGWVVWETSTPVQCLAWDGSALWAGHYKGGLSKWGLETGQVAAFNTSNGLTGNHVTSIADVADKGMPAALFMALTRTLVRAAVVETSSPAPASLEKSSAPCCNLWKPHR